jgi:hypothetical protein
VMFSRLSIAFESLVFTSSRSDPRTRSNRFRTSVFLVVQDRSPWPTLSLSLSSSVSIACKTVPGHTLVETKWPITGSKSSVQTISVYTRFNHSLLASTPLGKPCVRTVSEINIPSRSSVSRVPDNHVSYRFPDSAELLGLKHPSRVPCGHISRAEGTGVGTATFSRDPHPFQTIHSSLSNWTPGWRSYLLLRSSYRASKQPGAIPTFRYQVQWDSRVVQNYRSRSKLSL